MSGRMLSPRLTDLAIVAVVLVASWTLAKAYLPCFRASGGKAGFYQEEFGPAVMTACGRGYVAPDAPSVPALQAFLRLETGRFSCGDLPADVRIVPLNILQSANSYLQFSAGLVWRVAGISWDGLDIWLAMLFAVSVAAAYVALRWLTGRAIALILTSLWATSPLHLMNLPHYRDYAKTPFFMLAVVAALAAATQTATAGLIAIGAVFGVVQGLGFGMRTDVLFNYLPFVVAVFAGRNEGVLRNLRAKTACVAVSLVLFVGTAWPILKVYRSAGSVPHVALLGLTVPFDGPLRLRPAPYDFGYLYLDGYMSTVIRSYWARVHPDSPPAVFATPSYDVAGAEYYFRLARTFPGDFATRMVASSLRVFDLPFSVNISTVPPGVTNPMLAWLAERRSSFLLLFQGAGPLICAVALALVAAGGAGGLRRASALAFVVGAWAAYPFIQFEGRHVFHLEFLSLALLGVVVSRVWLAATRFSMADAGPAVARAARGGSFVAVGLIAVAGLLALSRAVQIPQARRLLTTYADASLDELPATSVPVGAGVVRLVPRNPDFAGDVHERSSTSMLVVDFLPARCASATVDVTITYDESMGFSRMMSVPVSMDSPLPTRVFLPAYVVRPVDNIVRGFAGLDVGVANAGCVVVRRFRFPERFPLLMDLTLVPGWERGPLYEQVYLGAILPVRVWLVATRWWPGLATLG